MEIYNDTFCVYMHTNKVNGKKYVGQTCKDPEERWHKGEGYKSCRYFYKAIQKYGWDNFEHEIIASNLTKEEADNFERLLIDKLNLTDHNNGYNLRDGGSRGKHSEESKKKISNANFGRHYTNEARTKISEATKGNNNPFYGKKHTKEEREKISIANKGKLIGDKNPNFNGLCCNEEWRKKQSESHKGKNSGKDHYNAKSVIQYDKRGAVTKTPP